jgi:hypothetical protein
LWLLNPSTDDHDDEACSIHKSMTKCEKGKSKRKVQGEIKGETVRLIS